jgi:hypothetical protein
MARKTRKAGKGRNGVGTTVTVYFDSADPREQRALQMAQLLASKQPGKRKDAIVALFDAMFDYYEQTGEMMTSGSITSALVSGAGRAPMGFMSAVSRQQAGRGDAAFHTAISGGTPNGFAMMELPSANAFDEGNKPLIQVMDGAPPTDRATPDEIAANIALEMGNMFDD